MVAVACVEPIDVQKTEVKQGEQPGACGLSLEQQQQNARKVTPPPVDTMAVHPDSHQRPNDSVSKVGDVAANSAPNVQAGQPSDSRSVWQRIYDTSQWIWDLVFPNEPVAETAPADNATPPVAAAPLTNADAEAFLKMMRDMMNHLKDLNEEEFGDQNIESLLHDSYKAHIRNQEQEANFSKEALHKKYSEKRNFNAERLQKIDQLISSSKHAKVWNHFEKAATTMGLVTVAAGVSTGSGALFLLFGLGLAVDQLFDDPAKKKIAAIIGEGSHGRKQKWLDTLRLGCGIASLAVCLGLGGPQAFQNALHISKGAAVTARGLCARSADLSSADLKHLSHQVTINDDRSKREIGTMKNIINNVYDHYKNLSTIHKNQVEASLTIVRR